ncbi:MAG: glucose/sorbosone family PQQ-dependent dehydrogenase [Bacteroidota bacterium]
MAVIYVQKIGELLKSFRKVFNLPVHLTPLQARLLSSTFVNSSECFRAGFEAFIFWQKIQFFAQHFPPSKGARGMLSGNFVRNILLTPFKRGNYTVLSPSMGKNLPDKREQTDFNIFSLVKQNLTALHLLKLFFFLFFINLTDTLQAQAFTMTPIGNNRFLNRPWDLHFGPDEFLWVTERQRGIVVRVNPETAERDELIRISDVFFTSGQEGLLGMALHADFADSAYVYLSYTYGVQGAPRQKLVRYTYEIEGSDGRLVNPLTILDNLPASNDHNSGRLIFGPDSKLYYTIGDQGGNQNRNYCNPILSQMLPTQAEIDQQNWANYPGKILRINLDGSIPTDNPVLNGVQSHIYSYGHRNAQGLVFGKNDLLYSDEHGPDTDDEVNRIQAGKNYGWPIVVGFQDNQAYDYCNWSAIDNCASFNYEKYSCPGNGTFVEETTLTDSNYQEPIASMFAVSDDYNFNDSRCGNSWICRPNVAPSSLEIYENDALPNWQNSLLVTSLKRGRVFRYKLNEDGTAIDGDTTQHFYTQNRYRDIVVHPNGKTFYLLCDETGRTSDASGLNATSNLRNPGNILRFTLNETTSIVTPTIPAPFSIYPNPASKSFFIEVDNFQVRWLKAELIDLSGQIIQQIPLQSANTQKVNVEHVAKGIYFLRVISEKQSWKQRVVVH